MSTKFHRHLKFYERDRICQCGACSTTSNLSLKFIYHYGIAALRKVGSFEKLFGSDVSLVHKLLKNNIPLSDYLLLTTVPETSNTFAKPDWMQIERSSFFYDGIGKVSFIYIPLEPLKSKLGKLPSRSQFYRYGRPVSVKRKMTVSLKKLHGIVTDFSLRPKWIFGLRLIKDRSNNLNTIGSKHLCVMPMTSMEFVISAQNIGEGAIKYVEQSNSIKWLAPLNVVFILKRISRDTSSITIHIHYK